MAGASASGEPRSAFVEWVEATQPEGDPLFPWTTRWLTASAMHAGMMVFTATAPGVRDFFRLQLTPVLALQLLALGAGFAANALGERRRLSPRQRGAVLLAIAFSFQLCYSGPVVFSQPPGTFVFAAMPILAAWFHANLRRTTLRAPYLMAAHGAAMAVAFALRPDATHAAVFATVAPLGLIGGLISGTLTSELGGQRAALDDHRSAISAQILAARASDVEHLSESLARASALRRAALAALGIARQRADALPDPARTADAAAWAAPLAALRAALDDVKAASDQARSIGRDVPVSSDGARPVAVLPLVHEIAASVAQRFPHVTITCRAPARGAERARVVVGGGEQGLRRIAENAITNACEGDGQHGAHSIDVLVSREPDLRLLAIEVRDDGPGFPAELLAEPIAPFATTKRGASGLGLYTAERLARAGGGFVRRENPPGRGARLSIFLAEAQKA